VELMNPEIEKIIQAHSAEAGVNADVVRKIVKGEAAVAVPKELEDEDSKPLYAALKDMTMSQKIKLAIFGNQTARALLIRDTNKMISMFVLQNARITENEIVEWARNKDLGDYILREIANNPNWMKLYSVKLNLVSNPRMPASIAVKWLGHILEKDLKKLSKSKDVPQLVANQAARMLTRKS